MIGDNRGGFLLTLGEHRECAGIAYSPLAAEAVKLSRREIEVLHWVEQGMANADIAVLCGISERTVHKHLQHAFQKLNVENRMAAVHKARELLAQARHTSSVISP
jgi:DNA-binding CsgD family transcriptional regulator